MVYPSNCRSRYSAERRQGARIDVRSMGRPKFAARCREAGVRFSDGHNFGACVAWEITSAMRGTRRFWTGGNAGKHSCRERSAEAENAQPPGSCRVPGSWNRAVDCRERSTEAENALPPCLVEGTEKNGLSGRLPKTLDRGREHSVGQWNINATNISCTKNIFQFEWILQILLCRTKERLASQLPVQKIKLSRTERAIWSRNTLSTKRKKNN